jgi:hypothetical protein
MRSSYNMKSIILKAIITATANTPTLTLQTYAPLKVRGITQVVSKHSQRCSFIIKNCAEMAILLLEKPQFTVKQHNFSSFFSQKHFQIVANCHRNNCHYKYCQSDKTINMTLLPVITIHVKILLKEDTCKLAFFGGKF